MGRADRVNAFVKRYDPELFCEDRDGKLCVLRKSQRIESYEFDEKIYSFVRPAPYLIFALTSDWTLYSESKDWGLEVIRERLQKIDSWNRDVAREILEAKEKKDKSLDRDLDNHLESYLKDHRREFARTTNDVLTHSLDKTIKGEF